MAVDLDFPLVAKHYDRGAAAYHVAAFGATGDGTTDDTTAIQAAITAAINSKKSGKVVFEPQKTYVCTAELNLDQSGGIHFECGTGRYGVGAAATTATLLFTQAGTGNCISARSSYGFTMQGMRVAYNNAAFTGVILNLDFVAYDTAYSLISGCEFKGTATARGAICISMHKAILMTIRDCLFVDATIGIRGKSGAGYCNGVQVEDCTFHRLTTAGIKNAAEAWLISGCNFETAADGGALGYDEDLQAFGPVTFKGCWFGDAVAAERPWIRYTGQALCVEGCMMAATGGAGTHPGILLDSTDGVMIGAHISGNVIGTLTFMKTMGTAGIDNVAFIGNYLLSGTLLDDSANPILNKTILHPGQMHLPFGEDTITQMGARFGLTHANNISDGGTLALFGVKTNTPGGAFKAPFVAGPTDGGADIPFEVWTGQTTRLLRAQLGAKGKFYVPVVTTPQSSAPSAESGMLATADVSGWDPAGHAAGDDYLVFHDGTAWKEVALAGGAMSALNFVHIHGTGDRGVYFRTTASTADSERRWLVYTDTSAANFGVSRYNDSGVLQSTPILINRSTGNITLDNLLITKATATGAAGFRLPHGTAPTSPVNGDLWTTTSGLLVRINGTTVTLATTGHTHAYTDLTYSGLTAGQVLRATSATAASFGALDLADTDAVTGTLADARLSSNVGLLTGTQTFTGDKTFTGPLVATGTLRVGGAVQTDVAVAAKHNPAAGSAAIWSDFSAGDNNAGNSDHTITMYLDDGYGMIIKTRTANSPTPPLFAVAHWTEASGAAQAWDIWTRGDGKTILGGNTLISGSERLQVRDGIRTDGIIAMAASTTTRASTNIPHGTAPTSPVNGDIWTTTAGLFVRINGSTVGPLT